MRSLLRSPLIIALLVALVGWPMLLWEPLGHGYWNMAYKVFHRSAPQSIVIVEVDDNSNFGVRGQARLFDLVRLARPERMYIDTTLEFGANDTESGAIKAAIARLDPSATFVVRASKIDHFEPNYFQFPDQTIVGHHPIVLSAWYSNFLYYAEFGRTSVDLNGVNYQTLSAALAGKPTAADYEFAPDFSIDPNSISRISAAKLLEGQISPEILAGKQVIISNVGQGALTGYFGHQLVRPLALDIAGAVALGRLTAINISQLPILLIVTALVWLGHGQRRGGRRKLWAYSGALAAALLLPVALRELGIVAYPDSALGALATFAAIRLWQKRTRRIQHTSASGLPNMLALSASVLPVGRDVVVAAVARYEEMLATLPRDLHGEFANQIARRIAVGSGTEEIYHSDGGHFAWTEEARPIDMQLSHLEGLRALFAAPLQIGPHTFDTNIHFGLDRNEGMDALTRVNSALASANEALANGRAIELFEAHRLAEAPWELSLHARIDEGLRNGDIWLAFQSQWDIATGRICGAEALIRWNHPTRGPIAPNAFILQAERAGRIDALTYWVLEKAISAALAINARGERFQMSVNLSAQMVDKPDLVRNFAEIVNRRGIDPGLITVEVTETSSVGNRAAAVHNLSLLRSMGFRLSIDDFGTGEASLAYLADLPSDELKLDRRFVSRIVDSSRERAIVASTIGLAHALGQTVVAEGIEDAPTLALLRDLGCDHAQGFHLGRPVPLEVFERDYDASRQRQGVNV